MSRRGLRAFNEIMAKELKGARPSAHLTEVGKAYDAIVAQHRKREAITKGAKVVGGIAVGVGAIVGYLKFKKHRYGGRP